MKARQIYLHLAEVCERAAATARLPETKVAMLASAAVWRRLAADFRPWEEAGSSIRQDKPAKQIVP